MSTLINNIDRLENAPNAGGAPWFQVVLPADIDTIPDRILDQIGSAITLNSGASAYNIMATTGSVQWNEQPQQVDGRQQYVSVFSFVIPKDRADVLNYAQHLNNRGVVAIVRDANDQSRLMGTKAEPATFRLSTRTLGGTQNGRNEHRYEIVLTSAKPVPFYEVSTHLPVPSSAPATVQLNGSTVGQIAAGATDSFDVLQGGVQAGSWNGSAWVVPLPTLAVVLSESTIDYGNTLTITANPTGFSPSSHMAFARSASDVMKFIGEQAGNVFSWVVDALPGSQDVYVQTDNGANSAALTITSNYMLNYATFLAAWSTIRRSDDFSDPILRALRSSDNDEADFTNVTGTPEVFDGDAEASNAIPTSHNGDRFSTFVSTDDAQTPEIYDQTGNGHHAAQSNLSKQPAIATAGVIESIDGFACYTFDGSADVLTVWNNTTAPAAWQGLSDAITIIAWLSPTSFVGTGSLWFASDVIIELRQNVAGTAHVPFSLGFETNKITCGFTDNSTGNAERVDSDAVLSTAQLQQIAVVINGDDVKLYYEGQLITEQTLTVATGDRSVGTTASTLSIGARSRDDGSLTNEAKMKVVDLKVAASAFTDDDILNNYNFYQS